MTATTAEVIGWCQAVLHSLGYPTTSAHLVGPLAWVYAEGGWIDNAATYNCWNTTQPMPGSHSINSVGVQAYPTITTGINATVRTLRNGFYPAVLTALAGGTPDQLAVAVGASPWGTPTGLIQSCIPRARAVLGAHPAPPVPPPPKPPPPLTKGELMGASIAVKSTGTVEIAAVGQGNGRDNHLLHVTIPPAGNPSIIDLTDQIAGLAPGAPPYLVAP